jgi:hypothetical protein
MICSMRSQDIAADSICRVKKWHGWGILVWSGGRAFVHSVSEYSGYKERNPTLCGSLSIL